MDVNSPDSDTSSDTGADYSVCSRRTVVSTPKLPDPETHSRKPSAVVVPTADPDMEKGDGNFSGMGNQGIVTAGGEGAIGPNDNQTKTLTGHKNVTEKRVATGTKLSVRIMKRRNQMVKRRTPNSTPKSHPPTGSVYQRRRGTTIIRQKTINA